ncbi:hypothetical protein ACIQUQ_30950 [Streptomyces sp. NPDC101118]|uniref:hypothetical protein n=1 Tax=Streptomyces sp. NPDC101118 TaxID=3366109 RepID=UPI00382698B1
MRPSFTVVAYAIVLGFALAPGLAQAAGTARGASGGTSDGDPDHKPVGTADGPADVALALGTTGAAATATGLWLRSRHRRDEGPDRGEEREP